MLRKQTQRDTGRGASWLRRSSLIYGWLFVYPTIQMVSLSFTNSPLIGAGEWIGFDNYVRAVQRPGLRDRGLEHRLFRRC